LSDIHVVLQIEPAGIFPASVQAIAPALWPARPCGGKGGGALNQYVVDALTLGLFTRASGLLSGYRKGLANMGVPKLLFQIKYLAVDGLASFMYAAAKLPQLIAKFGFSVS
jgi:hypothetical protein